METCLVDQYKIFKQQLISSRFVRNVFTLSFGTALSQLVVVLALPIISRLYSPSAFGACAVFMSISIILSLIVDGRYELAIVLPKSQRSAVNIMALSFLLNIFFCGVVTILLLIFQGLFFRIFDHLKIEHVLLFSYPLMTCLMSVNGTFQYMANRQKKYRIVAIAQIVSSFTLVFVQVSVGYYYPSLSTLVMGYVLSFFVSCLIFYFTIFNKLRFWNKVSLYRIRVLAKRYSKFPRYTLFSDLMDNGSIQLPLVLISTFFSTTVAGYFSMSYRALSAPIALIGGAFGRVFYQKAATLSDNPSELQIFVQKIYFALVIIAILPMTTIMVYGPGLFTYIFGTKWAMSGIFAQYMAIWLIFIFISSPISTLYFVKERQGLAMTMNVLMFLSRVLAVLIGYYLSLDGIGVIVVLSITGALLGFVNNLIILHLVKIRWLYSIGTFMLIFVLAFLAQVAIKKVVF